MRDLPGIKRREAALLELADVTAAESLARRAADEHGQEELSRLLLVPRPRIADLAAAAKIATFRGIGAENARLLAEAGVHTLEELAAEDPAELYSRLIAQDGGRRVRPQRVRVWVQAAQEDAAGR